MFFLLLLLEGCAVLNTFQTPKVKDPGKVSIGVGAGPILDSGNRDFDYPLVPFDTYIRVGIIPRIDVGVRSASFTSVGLDLKYQFLKSPFPVSINAGFGNGGYTFSAYGGNDSKEYHTKFAGIVAGYHLFYTGFKITDYHYQNRTDNSEIDRLIPGFTVGFSAPENETIAPIFEINSYFIPKVILTSSIGIKFNF